ncbi:hypothetical protein GCM10011608_49160 [Micromonospora sonchi]|uniref:Enoyl-CoA hydratase/isomerase family protein n=1 Tax=Micromonospora sonchi TaxID=1763543 RepID=A0A917X2X4_9ACTN|nr:hypothetical protein GCM10011608_49160 [Micromonospora sonchi]
MQRAGADDEVRAVLLTPRPLDADQARDWGLIAEVVEDEAVLARATAIAEQLAAGPSRAYGEAKRLLRTGWNESPENISRDEADTIARLLAGPEASARVERFLSRS